MPSAVHMHNTPGRASAGNRRNYVREPSQDSPIQQAVQGPYFPEGGVAAPPFMIVNPVSHGADTFPGNGTVNDLLGPATAVWHEVRDSDYQGVGVPSFKRWARQFHSETYNFDSLAVMPAPDQLGPLPLPTQRPVKVGWSVPKNSEQYEQSIAQGSLQDLMQTNDPASQAFAIGWGYVG